MSIKVAAWNVAKGLGDNRAEHIFEGINRLDADLVVLSEAYLTDFNVTNEEVLDRVEKLASTNGYRVAESAYNDDGFEKDPKRYNQHLVVLGRQALKGATELRLGSRNVLQLSVYDEKSDTNIQTIGAHFSDLNEYNRIGMANALISQIDLTKPTLLLGDLNAMHRDSIPARIINSSLGKAANTIFKVHPRTRHLSSRLVEMADGTTMNILRNAHFTDADHHHDSTFKFAGIPFAQLDHIMFAGPDIVAKTHIHHDVKGSDHKPISAIVHINQRLPRD